MWGAGAKRRVVWPQGMRFTIEDHAQNIKMLLFIRQAWSIAQDTVLPELSPPPDIGTSRIPDEPGREVWEARWKREWDRAWAWFDLRGIQHAPISQDGMRKVSRPGQDLHPIVPPFWTVEYGGAGIDAGAFNVWDIQSHPAFPSYAERDSAPEFIAAWREGLTTVIVLPYKGHVAQRPNDSHLVVSDHTRNDPGLYSLALSTWRGSSGG